MHYIILANRKAESNSPYFVDTEEGAAHNNALQQFKEDNPNLWINHEVFKTEESYVSSWEFEDETQASTFRQKLDENLSAMMQYRDTYIAMNGQELWSRTIKEDGTEILVRLIPPMENF